MDYYYMKLKLCILLFTAAHAKGKMRIIGGEEAPDGEYPWFFNSQNGCGGSLIAPDLVLTAAHCSSAYSSTWNFDESFIHPMYEEYDGYVKNDFMLVKLSKPIKNAETVQLDTGTVSSQYKPMQSLWALGYGDTTSDDKTSEFPDELHHVEVKYIDQCDCSSAYPYLIDSSMMCASDEGQDACQGDSGGPLYDKENDVLVGIVSWGYGCADSYYPGVYARIADQWPWIQRTACLNTDYDLSFCDDFDPNEELQCQNLDGWEALVLFGDPYGCEYFEADPDRCSTWGVISYNSDLINGNSACCVCDGGVLPQGNIDRASYTCSQPGDESSSGRSNPVANYSSLWLSLMIVALFSFIQ